MVKAVLTRSGEKHILASAVEKLLSSINHLLFLVKQNYLGEVSPSSRKNMLTVEVYEADRV